MGPLQEGNLPERECWGNPTVISSNNGMDDSRSVTMSKALHDTEKINFRQNYLKNLCKSIDKGANIVGYLTWSIDLCCSFQRLEGYPKLVGPMGPVVRPNWNDHLLGSYTKKKYKEGKGDHFTNIRRQESASKEASSMNKIVEEEPALNCLFFLRSYCR